MGRLRKSMKSLDRIKIYTITNARQLYEKTFSDPFHNTEHFQRNHLKLTTDCVVMKYGTPIATTQG